MKEVIAIDGYAATGKSSQAKNLAKYLNFIHIDSGAMYRAVTFFSLNNFFKKNQINIKKLIENLDKIDVNFKILNNIQIITINDENIKHKLRDVDVEHYVSEIASVPEVRSFLIKKQRQIAIKNNVVMDGRDIGTVVFPESKNKIFLTASPEIRAKRRFDQIKSNNKNLSFSQVLKNVKLRDKNDESRKISPLIPAFDAKIIDTSNYTKREVFNKIILTLQL
jgi:cytidylate kinase|tara:strand:- start:318 stop:983 length:666 start_codon:yes stop_codon:yes gene_type:complete